MPSGSTIHHTPVKKGSGSGNFNRDGDSLNAKPMRSLLKDEISAYHHSGIELVDIAVSIWGVERETANKILQLPLTLDSVAVENYKRLPTEGDLHQPFIDFAEELLQKVHAALHPNEPFESFKARVWDKEGNASLQHGGRSRKPDMLTLFKPMAVDAEVPWWGLVKHIIEMKHDTNKVAVSQEKSADTNDESHPVNQQPDVPNRAVKSVSTKPKVPSRLNPVVGSSHGRDSTHTADSDLTQTSGMVVSVAASSKGKGKRNIDEVLAEDDENAVEEEEQAVKRRKLAGKLKEDHLQLATYAVEAMSATSRNWVAGTLVDTCEVTVLLLDRHMVARTTTFNFDTDVTKFALMIYAMTRCNRLQAGFDPHLRASLSQITESEAETTATQVPEELPVPSLIGSYFEFPQKKAGANGSTTDDDSEAPPLRLKITGIIRQPDDLISRGTTVYKVKVVGEDGKLSEQDYALKLSWPLKQRPSEIDVIQHLKAKLPAELHAHLPSLTFSTSFSGEQLSLPWTKLGGTLNLNTQNFQERTLRAMLADYYHKLWEAGSPAAFKQAWLDCVECHYEAFRTGKVLHRDLSENNLMVDFVNEEVKGVVNDWDMAKFEGSNDSTSAAHHRTGTPPFMAIDLLLGRAWGHPYRYDLESFFYILLWAAIHYDLKQRKKLRKVHSVLKGWISNDMQANATAKDVFVTGDASYDAVYGAIRKEFKEIKETLIVPLHNLFCDALTSRSVARKRRKTDYDYVTCDGILTFHTFMEAINVKPRWATKSDT